MVLQTSGTINTQNIQTEFVLGTGQQKKLNANLGPLIAISANAPTKMSDFYGKAYAQSVTGISFTSVGQTSVTVNWSGGGAGATSFSITTSPAGTTNPQSATASGYSFTGLSASTAYTFTITSKNAQGVAGGTATGSVTTAASGGALYTMPASFTFTNMGATGRNGPTVITYAQNSTAWPGYGTIYQLSLGTGTSTGMQRWYVPSTKSYTITIAGAGGSYILNSGIGNNFTNTCYGAVGTATLSLTSGHIIRILIGQSGTYAGIGDKSTGGCGATYMYNESLNTLLAVAGGAGGCGADGPTTGVGASGSTTTTPTPPPYGTGTGGTGGGGGTADVNFSSGSGGGGYSGNGGSSTTAGATGGGGLAFLNGGTGGKAGTQVPEGGFGGGGGTYIDWGTGAPGGGGGYNGGGAGDYTGRGMGAGGGGSYISTSWTTITQTNSGQGYLTIS